MSGLPIHVAHMADDNRPDLTVCGEPWQDWQAPSVYPPVATVTVGEPRPHTDRVRQCGACFKRMMTMA